MKQRDEFSDLASRKRERRIMTASQVLCFSCIWMELNLRWMMLTMRSISLGEMGRVRDCSLSRFITWVVNSLHAWMHRQTGFIKRITITDARQLQTEQKGEIGFWRGCNFAAMGLVGADSTASVFGVIRAVGIKAASATRCFTSNKRGGSRTRGTVNIKKASLQWERKCDKWREI